MDSSPSRSLRRGMITRRKGLDLASALENPVFKPTASLLMTRSIARVVGLMVEKTSKTSNNAAKLPKEINVIKESKGKEKV